MAIAVGERAPGFTLPGTDGTDEGRRTYSLSEFAGSPVVLVFYPGDRTPVCTLQLNTYSGDIERFRSTGAVVLALSPQSVQSHEDFAAAEGGFAFPLLADEGKEVAQVYGTLGPLGFYRRSAFVIDGEGIVRYSHRATAGLTFRPTDELVAAAKEASG